MECDLPNEEVQTLPTEPLSLSLSLLITGFVLQIQVVARVWNIRCEMKSIARGKMDEKTGQREDRLTSHDVKIQHMYEGERAQ